jgi:hypothetical protein
VVLCNGQYRWQWASNGNYKPVTDNDVTVGSSALQCKEVHSYSFLVSGLQVIGARKTGWTPATGTAARTTFATYSAPVISAGYVQAEVQAIADHVQTLSRRMKAIIDDLHSTAGHGLLGT